MTNQETFDTVVEHLLRQGGPSMLPSKKTCAYRGENGRKCAAGILIGPIIRRQGHDTVLVRDLQSAHDASAENWNEKIKAELIEVANHHGLSTEVFDRVQFVPEVKPDAGQ